MRKRPRRRNKYGLTNLTGQQGINLVENAVSEMRFSWNPTNIDQGIDGTIEVGKTATRTATNRIIQIQAKATSKEFQSKSPEAFSFNCEPADIGYQLQKDQDLFD